MQDPIGHETLETMAQAKFYNAWLFELIRPYLQKNVCELGAGTGTFSNFIFNSGFPITAIDYRPEYLKIIKNKNKKISTAVFDLQSNKVPKSLKNKFDSIVILNVLEHLKDDKLALDNIYGMLKKHGKLIILVPGFNFAYGTLDINLGHFRRYTINGLRQTLSKTLFKKILCERYVNILGLFGWFFTGKILKAKSIPKSQVLFFEKISRLFLFFEKYFSMPLGLSLFAVLEKQ